MKIPRKRPEFIKGLPIREYCRQHQAEYRLTPKNKAFVKAYTHREDIKLRRRSARIAKRLKLENSIRGRKILEERHVKAREWSKIYRTTEKYKLWAKGYESNPRYKQRKRIRKIHVRARQKRLKQFTRATDIKRSWVDKLGESSSQTQSI